MTTEKKAPREFFVYENADGTPGVYAFEKRQPDYIAKGLVEHRCIAIDGDIDPYIYFIQNKRRYANKELKAAKLLLQKVIDENT